MMFDELKIFKARDIVYFMGGSFFIFILTLIIGDNFYILKFNTYSSIFVFPTCYIIGYLLQEIPSFLKLYQTSLSFNQSRIDIYVCRRFIHNAEREHYAALSDFEVSNFQKTGHKDDVVERIQFLRSICQVFGSAFIILALINISHGGFNYINIIVSSVLLVIGIFLIFRARVEAMQTQKFIRNAIKNNSNAVEQ